jgi:hypothetical protein
MADVNDESQTSDAPNLTETAAAEVHKQFRRTEAERVRMAAAAQGAIPRGAVVGVGEVGENGQANVQASLPGEQDGRRDAQIEVLMAAVRVLKVAQGAGGLGPAHGQAPPEAPTAQ